ncbi:MAG: DUF4038 domain-containing protein [Armatimonadaceae bacterium]
MSQQEYRFPLQVGKDGRLLRDSAGKAFLYQADTPWMLFLNCTPEETARYVRKRHEQGFTALQLQLTGFLGMKNRDGQLPFHGDQDFARPNEAYFAVVDRHIDVLTAQGLYLHIAPAWSGCCGEGWAGTNKDGSPKPLNANGREKCHAFGKWLGKRYADRENIGWFLGGDNDPWNAREEIEALALGLKETAPRHLLSYHAASTHSSTDVFPDARWLDVCMTYTYFRGFSKAWNRVQPDVHEVSEAERRKTPPRPFFLGESTYEGEHGDWGSAWQVRKQAWESVLGGATGHAYGSSDWKMESGWEQRLDRPGARSMKPLKTLLERIGWENLRPVSAGSESEAGLTITPNPVGRNDFAPSAVREDGKAALVYLPTPRTIRQTRSWSRAHWFDPTNGTESDAGTGQEWTPAAKNAGGDRDWVLVLER